MENGVRLLLSAFAKLRRHDPSKWENVQLHFIGTSYASSGRAEKTVEPLAAEYGLSDVVHERTDRVGYFEALRILCDSDGILVIGSDSPSYTPSKLYPCMMARRPMLSIMHEQSPAVPVLRACRAGIITTFRPGVVEHESVSDMLSVLDRFRRDSERQVLPDIDWERFRPYTAREMTRRQCAVFDRALVG
jgi:hypothetical protein